MDCGWAARRAVVALALAASACAGNGGELRPAPSTSSTTVPPLAVPLVLVADAQALIDAGEARVIDVRSSPEYAVGHLPGAELIDFLAGDFTTLVEGFPRDETYIVYGKGGTLGTDAARTMIELGFLDVRELEGGLDTWIAQGLPVEQ